MLSVETIISRSKIAVPFFSIFQCQTEQSVSHFGKATQPIHPKSSMAHFYSVADGCALQCPNIEPSTNDIMKA